MTTLDKVLTFIAACLAALAVVDPIGVPRWVQIVTAVLVAGFAAIGIGGAVNRTGNPPGQ